MADRRSPLQPGIEPGDMPSTAQSPMRWGVHQSPQPISNLAPPANHSSTRYANWGMGPVASEPAQIPWATDGVGPAPQAVSYASDLTIDAPNVSQMSVPSSGAPQGYDAADRASNYMYRGQLTANTLQMPQGQGQAQGGDGLAGELADEALDYAGDKFKKRILREGVKRGKPMAQRAIARGLERRAARKATQEGAERLAREGLEEGVQRAAPKAASGLGLKGASKLIPGIGWSMAAGDIMNIAENQGGDLRQQVLDRVAPDSEEARRHQRNKDLENEVENERNGVAQWFENIGDFVTTPGAVMNPLSVFMGSNARSSNDPNQSWAQQMLTQGYGANDIAQGRIRELEQEMGGTEAMRTAEQAVEDERHTNFVEKGMDSALDWLSPSWREKDVQEANKRRGGQSEADKQQAAAQQKSNVNVGAKEMVGLGLNQLKKTLNPFD